MSTSDGAPNRSGDDQVLSGALSEMASEGSFQADKTFDLPAASASQSSGDASAGTSAAQPAPTGDDGSDQNSSTAGAAPTVPDSSATTAADPLAGTEPFTYKVNGEARTLAGVYRVPGEGLMVPEEHAASIEALAERAEVLDRVSREVTAQNATYERLSAWQTQDAGGKTITLTGQQGLEARHVAFARMESAVSVIDAILSDPSKLLSLLAQDAQGNIVADPQAIETLQMRVQLAANTAEQQARSQFSRAATPQAPSQSSASQSYAASAPKVIEQAAGQGFASLSPDDKALLSEQIDRYVRPVTEDDRRWNPNLKLGAPIVDHAFTKVVEHLVRQRQASKTTAVAAEKAGKFNAGMDRGRQPAKAAAKPVAPVPAAARPDDRKKADWESPFKNAMEELAIPLR